MRQQLDLRQQLHHARKVMQRLTSHRWFLCARHIAFYWPADGELDVRPLLKHAYQHDKTCYLPVLKPQHTCWGRSQLWFARYRPGDRLQPNRFGIPEPLAAGRHMRLPWQLDLMLLPLVGFDANCHRLGMGGGFYDRTLAPLNSRRAGFHPHLIGIAHDCQRVASLDAKPWDIALDAVISECRIYIRNSPSSASTDGSAIMPHCISPT